MSADRFVRTRYIPPATLGLNAQQLGAERTSSSFDATGANSLSLRVSYARNAGTGNLDLKLDIFDTAINDWIPMNAASIASGVATMDEFIIRKATGDASIKYEARLTDLHFGLMRIRVQNPTSATTSDTITIAAEIGYKA